MLNKKTTQLKKAGINTLKVLEAIADGLDLLNMTRNHQRIFALEGFSGLRRVRAQEERAAIANYYRYLKRKKLIQEIKFGDRLAYAVTDKGRFKILCAQFKSLPKHPEGISTIIIYDIPESQRRARQLFRRFLRENKFTLCQKSVWITDIDVVSPLSEFIRIHKLSPYIQIFNAKKVNILRQTGFNKQ